ncbi:MAG: class I ribonucleotide reductase maintenance protein YfaE [Vibrio sp.]
MKSLQINGITKLLSVSLEQTLLEAMETSGLEPEYNCRDGHCGACRCELLQGEVEYVGFAMAYVNDNEILPCICKAKTDVILKEVRYQARKKRA